MLLRSTAVALIVCTTTYAKETFSDVIDSNKNVTRTYDVSKGFDIIESDLIANIIFTQTPSETPTLKIVAHEDYLKIIQVEVKNGALILKGKAKQKNINLKKESGATIYISAPSISQIKIDGVGSLSIPDGIETKSLTIYSEGVGNATIKGVKCENISVYNSSIGAITLSGTAENAILQSDGVGSIKAEKLQSTTVEATCGGVGSISCFATKKLTANMTGVGNIRYRGNPDEKEFKKDGIGRISKL